MKVSVDEKGRPTVEDTLDRQSNINGGNKNLLYCRKRLENNRKTLKSSAQKQRRCRRVKCSQFSLSAVIMSYKVAVNTDLENTKPPLLGETQG